MNLFLADTHKSFEDLFKGVKVNLMPKTPGASTGGSVDQVVDCPLGDKCPDPGKKHKMGGKRFQQHAAMAGKQAAGAGEPGKKATEAGEPAPVADPNAEAKGEPTGKPGVSPATTNIGSVGSDAVAKPETAKPNVLASRTGSGGGPRTGSGGGPRTGSGGGPRTGTGGGPRTGGAGKPPAGTGATPEAASPAGGGAFSHPDLSDHEADMVDEYRQWENENSSEQPNLKTHLADNGITDPERIAKIKQIVDEAGHRAPPTDEPIPFEPTDKQKRALGEGAGKARAGKKGAEDIGTAKTQAMPASQDPGIGSAKTQEMPATPAEDVPGAQAEAASATQAATPAETVAEQAAPSNREPIVPPPPTKKQRPLQDVPNPLTDPSSAPPTSTAMDHYRLSQVAKDSGDDELADQHVKVARERTTGFGSEDHKKLAEDLHQAGMKDHASHHESIHTKATEDTSKVEAASSADSDFKKNAGKGPRGERFDLERGSEEFKKETAQRKGENYHSWRNRLEKEHGVYVPTDQEKGKAGDVSFMDSGWSNSAEDRAANKQKLEEKKQRVKDEFEAKRAKHHSRAAETAHTEKISGVHAEQKEKARKVLDEAKATHEATQKKASEIRDKNKAATEAHEAATQDYEKRKAAGEKGVKKPKKPTLEQEPEVAEKPELTEPESDIEKLRHQTHTDNAGALASSIESHLKNNSKLSDADRKRAERAHAISVFHSNIKHTPNAAHKAEMAEVSKVAKDMGIHESWKAPDSAEAASGGSGEFDELDKLVAKKQTATAKQEAKTQATEAKAQAKAQADAPKPPENDLDHARVGDHTGRAKALRDKVQSHLDGNPDMSDEDRSKAERIMSALDGHANMENVPTKQHASELKELHKLAGEMGKKPYAGGGGGEEGADTGGASAAGLAPRPQRNRGSTLDYLMGKVEEGVSEAPGMASAVTSAGGAGRLGSQAVNYGIHGAIGVGHQLLRDAGDNQPRYEGSGQALSPSEQRKQQDAEADRQEKRTMTTQAQAGTGGSA